MAKLTKIVRERIARLFYGLFIWAMRESTPKPSQIVAPDHSDEHIGVACVLCSSHMNVRGGKIIHSWSIKSTKSSIPFRSFPSLSFSLLSSSSTSTWTASTDGDLLGTESGVHMSSSEEVAPWEETKPCTSRASNRSKSREIKRDIPPPISLLRGRGKYTGPIPWSLHREYVDGRLILREATAEKFEYLESIRENGRLIMNLVSVDNSASFCDTIEEEGGEGEEEQDANPIADQNEASFSAEAAIETKGKEIEEK